MSSDVVFLLIILIGVTWNVANNYADNIPHAACIEAHGEWDGRRCLQP